MFYLASYAFMNIGAFAVVTHLRAARASGIVAIDDISRGSAYRQPVTAAMLTIFLLSLIGVPLTGGFFGKFYIFKAALDREPGLADDSRAVEQRGGRLLLPAHPGGDVHARAQPRSTERLQPMSAGIKTALWVSAVATLVLGVFPGRCWTSRDGRPGW